MKVIIINLDDSRDRLDLITSKLAIFAMDCETVQAIDGRGKPSNFFSKYIKIRSILRHGREMVGGEVACYLSHLKALEAFLGSGDDIAVILEDDADIQPDFMDTCGAIIAALEQSNIPFYAVNLGSDVKTTSSPIVKLASFEVRRAFHFPAMATGIIWSREGAMALLNSKYGKSVSGPWDIELRSFFARNGRGIGLDRTYLFPIVALSDIDFGSSLRWQKSHWAGALKLFTKIFRRLPDRIWSNYFLIKQGFLKK
jgi:glycosyl transferase, family 25